MARVGAGGGIGHHGGDVGNAVGVHTALLGGVQHVARLGGLGLLGFGANGTVGQLRLRRTARREFDFLHAGAEVQMLGHAILQLVGVADQVCVIKAQHGEEVVHALHIAIDDPALDGVAHLAAEQPAPLLRHCEVTLHDRRADVDLEVHISTVQPLHQLYGHSAVAVGCLARAAIGRVLKRDAGHGMPAGEGQRQRDLRAHVITLNDARRGEVRLHTLQPSGGRGETPQQRRAWDGAVHRGEVKRGYMKDLYLLPRGVVDGYALQPLVAVRARVQRIAICLSCGVDRGQNV